MRLTAGLDGLVQDARHAARGLRRSPGYAFTAIATLALGIGLNATVFAIAYSVLFKGFPLVERNDELVYVSIFAGGGVGYSEYEDWRAAKSLQGAALVHGVQQAYGDESGFAETLTTTEVTANTFALVGRKPIIGRDFAASDEAQGAAAVAILSYEFWERRYGLDSAVLGKTVRINAVPTTVVGVMPRGFSFPQKQDVWVPKVPTPEARARDNRDNWFMLGRLADGATIDTARAELETIGRRLQAEYPDTNRDLLPRVQTFDEFFIGPRATMIYVAMIGAVTFVLLIACANLANLLLARALSRGREISVRVALGAARGRVVRQLALESLMLSSVGGVMGWLLAEGAVRVFGLFARGPSLSDAIGGSWWDGMTDYALDGRVLAYLVAVSIGTGLLVGLAPASRLARLDVNSGLKDGGRAVTGVGGKRLSSLLLVAEVSLAIVLLAGAGVMVRSFLNIYTADLGARTAGVSSALLQLRPPGFGDANQRAAFFAIVEQRLAAAPEIESFAITSALPAEGLRLLRYEVEGAPLVDARTRPTLGSIAISPSYFTTLGSSLLQGREFDALDTPTGLPVAVVNARLAAAAWPGESPIGKRVRTFTGEDASDWLTVVGVAPDIAQNASRQKGDPLIYTPYDRGRVGAGWLIARARAPVADVSGVLQREIRAADPTLAIALGPFAIDAYLSWHYQYRGTSGALFLGCAAIALLLASIGLYAVMSYFVSQHTRELGVRIAIGASDRSVLMLVFRQGMAPLVVGLLVGLAAALAVNRLLASLLVEVSPADPVTLAVTCCVLIVAAMLGCWVPARRALSVDPLMVLRQD